MRKLIVLLSLAVFVAACGRKEQASPAGGASAAGGVGASAAPATPGSSVSQPEAAATDTGPIDVAFPDGFTSVTLRGRITDGKDVIYVVPLTAGEILRAKIVESNPNNDVVFTITSPFDRSVIGDAGEDYDNEWEGKLAETGDFTISVGTIETKDSPFVLELEVKNRP